MKGEDMAEFEITERTEPFSLDEVFSFIDDTNISKTDAHELKSRIVDMVQAERSKAIDDVLEKLSEYDSVLGVIPAADLQGIIYVIEQLKGGAE